VTASPAAGPVAAGSSCRLTLVGTRRRLDLVLPADVPVADYLRDVVTLLDEPFDDPRLRGLALGRLGSEPLPADRSLADAGVVDGDVLYLRDVRRAEAPSRVEDVIEAVQDRVELDPGLWRPDLRVRLALSAAGLVSLVLAALLVAGEVDRGPAVALWPAAGALLLLAAARVLERVRHRPAAAAGSAAASWPPAAAAGALAGAGSTAGGVGGAAVGLLAALALSAVAAPAVRPVATGVLPGAALTGAVAAGALLGLEERSAAGLGALVGVLLLGLLPRLAVGAGGLATLDDAALSGASFTAEDVDGVVRTAHRVLTWSVVSTCLALLACLVVLGTDRSGWARALAVLVAVLLLLRARGLVLARQVVPPLAAGAAALLLTGLATLVRDVAEPDRAVLAAAVLGAAVLALVLAGGVDLRLPTATRVRRLLDRAERLLVLAAVPVLAGLLGLYRFALDLVG